MLIAATPALLALLSSCSGSGGASGFWIIDGVITHPVRGLTIAGRASDILNAIDMMGNDLDLNRSFVSPTFRVAEMQIGGR